MRILIDMNRSPDWVEALRAAGWEVRHWSEVGEASAPDVELMDWARLNGHLVFTHDLDFGAILAATGAMGPSVVQMRCEDTRPSTMGPAIRAAIEAHREDLVSGALVTIDPRRKRIRLLPLRNA